MEIKIICGEHWEGNGRMGRVVGSVGQCGSGRWGAWVVAVGSAGRGDAQGAYLARG